jgi:hypothetical protein
VILGGYSQGQAQFTVSTPSGEGRSGKGETHFKRLCEKQMAEMRVGVGGKGKIQERKKKRGKTGYIYPVFVSANQKNRLVQYTGIMLRKRKFQIGYFIHCFIHCFILCFIIKNSVKD